jgi:phage gpG-like protein
MSDGMRVEIIGGDAALKAFDDLVARFPAAAQRGVMKAAHIVQGSAKSETIRSRGIAYSSIKTHKTKYQALGAPIADQLTSRTGALRASIRVVADTSTISALVGPAVVYGGVHELGGTIRVPALSRLSAKRKDRMVNLATGERVMRYVKVAKHTRGAYTITMPKRPYLWPAFQKHKEEARQMIVAELSDIIGRMNT